MTDQELIIKLTKRNIKLEEDFATLEKTCVTSYNTIQEQKITIDALEKQITEMEGAKQNGQSLN